MQCPCGAVYHTSIEFKWERLSYHGQQGEEGKKSLNEHLLAACVRKAFNGSITQAKLRRRRLTRYRMGVRPDVPHGVSP